jgi:hypothetical protein
VREHDAQEARSLPARIVVFAYGFVLLIILALYTANAAAQLTARLASDVRGPSDLRGRAVGAWATLTPRLQAMGISAVPLAWCGGGLRAGGRGRAGGDGGNMRRALFKP